MGRKELRGTVTARKPTKSCQTCFSVFRPPSKQFGSFILLAFCPIPIQIPFTEGSFPPLLLTAHFRSRLKALFQSRTRFGIAVKASASTCEIKPSVRHVGRLLRNSACDDVSRVSSVSRQIDSASKEQRHRMASGLRTQLLQLLGSFDSFVQIEPPFGCSHVLFVLFVFVHLYREGAPPNKSYRLNFCRCSAA